MAVCRKIRHGSLFSGIGGFDIAAQWCGWKNMFHCEIDEFCNKVLKFYWPMAASIKNIVGYDWEKWKGKIDVLSGGWPCQRYSIAGKRQGNEPLKAEMLRAIRLLKPAWCLLENVYGFITKGFAQEHDLLCKQLEDMAYDVQTFDIDAASCGLPTLERHVWIIAAPTGNRLKGCLQQALPDIKGAAGIFQRGNKGGFNRWLLSASRVCKLGEGVPDELDTETISKKGWHSKSIKAFGNAIVPPVAYYLFMIINFIIRKEQNLSC